MSVGMFFRSTQQGTTPPSPSRTPKAAGWPAGDAGTEAAELAAAAAGGFDHTIVSSFHRFASCSTTTTYTSSSQPQCSLRCSNARRNRSRGSSPAIVRNDTYKVRPKCKEQWCNKCLQPRTIYGSRQLRELTILLPFDLVSCFHLLLSIELFLFAMLYASFPVLRRHPIRIDICRLPPMVEVSRKHGLALLTRAAQVDCG